jgi:hypothetical protein
MKEIFYKIREQRGAAILDEKDSLGVIYKGIKYILEGDVLTILNTDTDLYSRVSTEQFNLIIERWK